MTNQFLYGLAATGFCSLAGAGAFLYWLVRLPVSEPAARMLADTRPAQIEFLAHAGRATIVAGLVGTAVMSALVAAGWAHWLIPIACAVGWMLSALCGLVGVLSGMLAAPRVPFALRRSLAHARRVAALPNFIVALCVIGFVLLELFAWLVFVSRALEGECAAAGGECAGRVAWLAQAPGGAAFRNAAIARWRASEVMALLLACGLGSVAQACFARLTMGRFADAVRVGAGHVRKKIKGLQDGDARNPVLAAETIGAGIAGVAIPCMGAYAVLSSAVRVTLSLATAFPLIAATIGRHAASRPVPDDMAAPIIMGCGVVLVPFLSVACLGISLSPEGPLRRWAGTGLDFLGGLVVIACGGILAWRGLVPAVSFACFAMGIGAMSIVLCAIDIAQKRTADAVQVHPFNGGNIAWVHVRYVPALMIGILLVVCYASAGGGREALGGWGGIAFGALGMAVGSFAALPRIARGAVPLWIVSQKGEPYTAEARRGLMMLSGSADRGQYAVRCALGCAAVVVAIALIGASLEQARFWLSRMAGASSLKAGAVALHAVFPDGVVLAPDDLLIALAGFRDLARAFDLSPFNPLLIAGVVLGAAGSYAIAEMLERMTRSGSTAIVEEVRRQFREQPGIARRSATPDYRTVVQRARAGVSGGDAMRLSAVVLIMGAWCVLAGTAGALGAVMGCAAAGAVPRRADEGWGLMALCAGMFAASSAGIALAFSQASGRIIHMLR
ncbi:MAG TPA: sodium/proton-translocating pyrophosphatase [Spirochaetota bacterium]|nr:sodium/proton-translocating pyrophosphatase [Spirochaetota bacterium]HOS39850.1 sodium/proton-translocating pyrophosphatase [Spirochaetota bacterium]HPU88901.1 sodium/proton-translocating pyrophosphatase [Spirochaetota bacterium]